MTIHAAPRAEPDGLSRIMAEMPRYGSEFDRTLANHAPMVLVALSRIGGSPERLRDFFEHYRDDKALMAPPPPVAPLDRTTWVGVIGERGREADLRAFFAGEVARLGIAAALREYLPRLAPGVGASALHALMRTAYGLLRESEDDISIALAYWAATYLEMPPSGRTAAVTTDPAEVLRRVAGIEALHRLPLEDLLWKNMRASGRTAEFAPVVDWLAIDGDTLRRMAAASIALFTATQDFCALHAVTGTHWIRLVLPYCDPPEPLLRHYWQCIAGLMREMDFPALPEPETLERWRTLAVPSWREIEAAAARSYDEHDISLVFSAREEMAVYGDPLYQLAAARRVNLVPDYTANP